MRVGPWPTIQNKTTRDNEQTRVIHSGAVNDRTNHIYWYVNPRARYGNSTNRSTRHITHRFTQQFAYEKFAYISKEILVRATA